MTKAIIETILNLDSLINTNQTWALNHWKQMKTNEEKEQRECRCRENRTSYHFLQHYFASHSVNVTTPQKCSFLPQPCSCHFLIPIKHVYASKPNRNKLELSSNKFSQAWNRNGRKQQDKAVSFWFNELRCIFQQMLKHDSNILGSNMPTHLHPSKQKT